MDTDTSHYWSDACRNLDFNLMTDLDKALGVRIWQDYSSRVPKLDYPLPDEWIALLTKLAGPHGKTILRAYQAKHGIKVSDGS